MSSLKIVLNQEVQNACSENRPIVALESTIISHGMPYPENIRTSKEVENVVRENGAVPATIAIINGDCKIGLNDADLEALAKAEGVMKASRRDIAFAIAQKKTAATTVAATMILAHKVGINIFATGGIGGVHRGVAESWDVSADLEELKRTPVHVVCAGVKSILDIPKTLEYLETSGVPVITFGEEEFPAFFSDQSGVKSPFTMNSTKELAEMIAAQSEFGFEHGSVIALPLAKEDAVPKQMMDELIQTALIKATEKQVTGKDITPFLLNEIAQNSKGESLKSNIKLIKANAKLAAQIAVDLALILGIRRK